MTITMLWKGAATSEYGSRPGSRRAILVLCQDQPLDLVDSVALLFFLYVLFFALLFRLGRTESKKHLKLGRTSCAVGSALYSITMPAMGRAQGKIGAKQHTHAYNAKMDAETRARKKANKDKVDEWFKSFDTDHTVRRAGTSPPASPATHAAAAHVRPAPAVAGPAQPRPAQGASEALDGHRSHREGARHDDGKGLDARYKWRRPARRHRHLEELRARHRRGAPALLQAQLQAAIGLA